MPSTRYNLRNFPRSLRVCYGSAPCGYKLSLTAPQVPLSTRNLRLHFRLVDAGSLRSNLQSPRSHTVSHVPPTHRRRCSLHSTPSALTPPLIGLPLAQQEPPMVGAPMHVLRSGNGGDRCAHFVQPPAHGTEGSANSQTASGF